jgi:hypothetical protein
MTDKQAEAFEIVWRCLLGMAALAATAAAVQLWEL